MKPSWFSGPIRKLVTRNISLLLVLQCFFVSYSVHGQFYNTHYVAPASWQYWHDAIEIVVSTPSDSSVIVEVYKSDSTYLTTLSARAGIPAVFRPTGNFRNFPRHPLNTIVDGAGILFKSDTSFSVNVRNVASDQLGTDVFIKGNASLTSLGNPGIGVSYRVGYYRDGPLPSELPVYSVMALYDNTLVSVNGVQVTQLNAGQSYLFRDRIGSLVECSRPCVMNTGSFLDAPGGCGDGTFDQIPPVNALGNRYFIVRTQGNPISEQSTLVGTKDSTKIFINRYNSTGNYISTDSVLLINAGNFYTISNGDGASPFSVAEIVSDKNIAVYIGSAQSCEVDVSTSFPVSSPCNGSNFIETSKFKAYNLADLPYFCYVLLADSTAQVDFNGASLESLVGRRRQIGSTGMYIITFNSAQLGNPRVITISSAVKLHIAIIQIGGGFSMSASFSNLIEQPPIIEPVYVQNGPCPHTSVLLSTITSVKNIQWYFNGSPISGAIDSTYNAIRSGVYHVRAFLPCGDFSESIPISVSLDSIPHSHSKINACEFYQWEDSIFTQSGSHTRLLTTPDGCDSLASIELVINSGSTSYDSQSACGQYIWPINGNTYSKSGRYMDTLINHIGCDSIIVLDLDIYTSSIQKVQAEACNSYFWDVTGKNYTNSGQYIDTLSTHNACDSILILDLTIYKSFVDSIYKSSCTNYFWPITGTTYNRSGVYTAKYQSVKTCDSIIVLNLIILPSSTSEETISACGRHTWMVNGMVYEKSGVYQASFINSAGCDSIITLNLEIFPEYNKLDTQRHCGSFTWPVNGIKYTTSGDLRTTLNSKNGCDSIIMLNLEIYPEYNMVDTQRHCGSYRWPVNGNKYTTSGDVRIKLHTKHGCDSILNLNLRIDSTYLFTDSISALDKYYWSLTNLWYDKPGTYYYQTVSQDGCDSLHILLLGIRKRGNVWVPNVFSPNFDGINDRFVVYASSEIKIIKNLRIYDRWGELVFKQFDFPPNQDAYGWDGIFRGQACSPAVFAWVVEWEDNEGDYQILAGDATLVR